VIEGINSISVFDDGETLLAFEAKSENVVHLYVYNENDRQLTRINRFGFPASLRLFPRWHRDRREIAFVCDYSVAAWASGVDPLPGSSPNFDGHRRTATPSVWTIRLADRP
jgi:Tol biopolymer transport system component